MDRPNSKKTRKKTDGRSDNPASMSSNCSKPLNTKKWGVGEWASLLSNPKRIGEPKGMELSAKSLGIITLILLLGIMFISANTLQKKFSEAKITVYEEPLKKVKKLALVPGESYTYSQKALNESIVNYTFWIMKGSKCTVISTGGTTNDSFICIDEWGNELSGGNNLSYSNPYILLFKPWMLAVEDNWHWNVSIELTLGVLSSKVMEVNYTTIKKDNYRGREAFLVKVQSSESNQIIYLWIDEKKRVLLLENGTHYEIELIDGVTFAEQNQQNSTPSSP